MLPDTVRCGCFVGTWEREESIVALALLQAEVPVDQTWLDYLIIGIYFVFVLGIGALIRKRMQSSA